MTNTYELYEVHSQDLSKTRDLLRKKFPDSITVYGFIDICLRYGPFKNVQIKFYCAKSEEFASFCCATIINSENRIANLAVYWDAAEIEESQASKLISNLHEWNWNWNQSFVLLVSSYQLKLIFDRLMEKQIIPTNLKLSDMTSVHSPEAFILYLSKEDYKDPEVPTGYVLRKLPPSCSSHILSKWSFNYTETQEAVQERLSVLNGIGAFRMNSHSSANFDDTDNNFTLLVSWSHQYFSGAIGMTYTVPEERGKGFAGAVTLALAKSILDEGRMPFCFIESTNSLSLKLHQKLGFKIIGTAGISLYTGS